jgi:hypothetical protein
MIRQIKTIFKKYFGMLVLLIPLAFFLLCYLYSNKRHIREHFSLGDLSNVFSKESKNLQIETDNTFQNNYTNKNIFTRPRPVDSSNFETNTMRNVKNSGGSLQPVGNSLFGNVQCRVLSECTDGFRDTGAEFEGIKCQNDTSSRQAKAVASIKNGYIDNIHLVDSGLGYKDDAKIMIIGGNGSDAVCSAILDVDNSDKSKRTSIKKIEIKNSGRNYNSTPKVLIENPSSNHKCKLCCK